MALGYIAAFSETLSLAVISSKGLPALQHALESEGEDHLKSASVWSIGQIGRHSGTCGTTGLSTARPHGGTQDVCDPHAS